MWNNFSILDCYKRIEPMSWPKKVKNHNIQSLIEIIKVMTFFIKVNHQLFTVNSIINFTCIYYSKVFFF
jgi:hypothetical protein